MLYLATPSGLQALAAMRDGLLGYMDTPRQRNTRPDGVTWAADNGCFGKGYPGDEAWLAWLAKHAADAPRCLFATAPDVVGDAAATLARSRPWLPKIRELGYPAALVAQNGLEHLEIPWDEFDVLFIGGSVECREHGPTLDGIRSGRGAATVVRCPVCLAPMEEWKLGRAARRLVAEAKTRGKGVHCGRVNSRRRFDHMELIGCDSVDGTYLKFGSDQNLPRLLLWTAETGEELASA